MGQDIPGYCGLINMWRLWSYALGRKEGRNDTEANIIASIRTIILLTYLITNCFIVAGVIRHWNDIDTSAQTTYTVK